MTRAGGKAEAETDGKTQRFAPEDNGVAATESEEKPDVPIFAFEAAPKGRTQRDSKKDRSQNLKMTFCGSCWTRKWGPIIDKKQDTNWTKNWNPLKTSCSGSLGAQVV